MLIELSWLGVTAVALRAKRMKLKEQGSYYFAESIFPDFSRQNE